MQAQERYSTVAIALHWLIALAIAFELALGFAMPKGVAGFELLQLHKSVGITILALTVLRIGWRLFSKPPASLESGLTGALARIVHFGFYAFLLLAPLTGWALVSTSPTQIPTVLFGLIPFPHLPLPAGINEAVEEAHELLAWLALALIALHVAGIVRHELLLRHGGLGRISPAGRSMFGVLLGGAVIVAGAVTFLTVAGTEPEKHHDTAVAAQTASPIPESPTATPTAEAEEAGLADWSIRPGGRLGFSVANGSDAIQGSFASWDGKIHFDPEKPETAAIAIEIDLASATVGDATQDQMLAGDEYFSVAAHSKAVLKITSARSTGYDKFAAQGTLQLKGVSRPQAITFRLSGSGRKRHVEGSATISRAPFAIGTGETGAGLAPTVKVNFSFDAEAES